MSSPQISVFTPSHDPTYLDDAYKSLDSQILEDWEWVVLLNAGAEWTSPVPDPRVRVIASSVTDRIGALKAKAVEFCRAPKLVELDHDDLLTPDALMAVDRSLDFAGFCFSDWSHIRSDGSPDPDRPWSPAHGWLYYDTLVDRTLRTVTRAQAATPRNLSRIWWSPNHLRAFTRAAYDQVGGYSDLDILDDQDLMSRLYLTTPFTHIKRCLYLQRLHAAQSQVRQDLNDRIQVETVEMGDRWLSAMTRVWESRDSQ